MPEIYTGDLIEIAYNKGDEISNKIGYSGYRITDGCCDLYREISSIIYERLSVEFEKLLDEDFIKDEKREELSNKLFKMINEL